MNEKPSLTLLAIISVQMWILYQLFLKQQILAQSQKFNLNQLDDIKNLNLSTHALLQIKELQTFYLKSIELDVIPAQFQKLNLELNIIDESLHQDALDIYGVMGVSKDIVSSTYKLYISNHLLEKNEFTTENLIAIFSHELGHIDNHDLSFFKIFIHKLLSHYSFLIFPLMIESYLNHAKEYKADEFAMRIYQGKCYHFIDSLYKIQAFYERFTDISEENIGFEIPFLDSFFEKYNSHPSHEERKQHLLQKGCIFFSHPDAQQCDWVKPNPYRYQF